MMTATAVSSAADGILTNTRNITTLPPPPEHAIMTLGYDEACILVDVDDQRGGGKITFFCREYGMKNHLAKILGATAGWYAMPPLVQQQRWKYD